ncbi:hypothetical protein QBC44DRAFT_241545 [Cladorrhinum sp. PSN332]|nr:hypothetical protein QBC44DRAFT_241545 [Cladorrhinum sp. PSN332]
MTIKPDLPPFSLLPLTSPIHLSSLSPSDTIPFPPPMGLHCIHSIPFHPSSSFLTRYITFYINIIIPNWFWHSCITMHAFISTPTPTPPLLPSSSSTTDACLIPRIITDLTQQKWTTAFEAISNLPHTMHLHPAKIATFDDLHHINTLFEAIMHHHTYGIDASTDQALNQLLLIGLSTCQALRSPPLSSLPDAWTQTISWSPPSDISIQEHLEFYRAVLHYFLTFTTAPCDSLIAAKRLLHHLSPRINNLSTWNPKTTQTASSQQKRQAMVYVVHSARATKEATQRKKEWSSRLRSRQSGGGVSKAYVTPSPTCSSPSSGQRRKLRPRTQPKKTTVMMSTPPTQSGDACTPSYKSTGEYLPTQGASTAASSCVQVDDKCIQVGTPDDGWEEQPTLLLGSERRREYFLGLMDQALQESIARDIDDDSEVIVVGGDGGERKHSVDMGAFRLRPGHEEMRGRCSRKRENVYRR